MPTSSIDRDDILEAIRNGVADAILELMDPFGRHPMTRDDILAAIRDGASQR